MNECIVAQAFLTHCVCFATFSKEKIELHSSLYSLRQAYRLVQHDTDSVARDAQERCTVKGISIARRAGFFVFASTLVSSSYGWQRARVSRRWSTMDAERFFSWPIFCHVSVTRLQWPQVHTQACVSTRSSVSVLFHFVSALVIVISSKFNTTSFLSWTDCSTPSDTVNWHMLAMWLMFAVGRIHR